MDHEIGLSHCPSPCKGGDLLELILRPIGIVEEGLPRSKGGAKSRFSLTSKIRLFDEFVDGLEGLENYSHAFILYWFHEIEGHRLRARPFGGSDREVGIFATRSPHRVNPLGLTVVEILEVSPPLLIVRGLDAWSGSPVVDIKPYNYYDIVRCPGVPEWFKERWADWKRRKKYDEIAPWLGPCCHD